MGTFFSNAATLFKQSYQEWKEDDASRQAAALAYYTIFSLAPLLVLVIAVAGLIWKQDVVRTQLLNQIRDLVGAQGATFIQGLIVHQGTQGQTIFATLIGAVVLIFGALGVFEALHKSLNIIWDVEEKPAHGFWDAAERFIEERVVSFTVIMGIGFLLLVSLVLSTGLSAAQTSLAGMLPLPGAVLQIINLLISIAVITVLFAMMYKVLPDANIAWRDVWLGALMTAILFSVGKTIIGLYLGRSNVASAYGAAGSLILLLLWIYYSAQIVFFGAEMTQVYANLYGSKIVPEKDAVSTKTTPASGAAAAWRRQPAKPALVSRDAVPSLPPVNSPVEAGNRQTARVLLGMLIASFLSGLSASFFTLRKRR